MTGLELPFDYPFEAQLSADYGYSIYLSQLSQGRGVSDSKIRRPSMKIASGDNWMARNGYTYFGSGVYSHEMAPGKEWERWPHNNSSNILFADCHVKRLPANWPNWFNIAYWDPEQ